ncbi:cytochrome P450 [Pleurotus eryngii]|uniref:Cytochrome P450 n=1 Tax=Pleurotus eryngii TaxID=5323 RepID=A0A9P5ZIM9_PLEER|nr:cytochrome P450 [Pleurotus eryngii]
MHTAYSAVSQAPRSSVWTKQLLHYGVFGAGNRRGIPHREGEHHVQASTVICERDSSMGEGLLSLLGYHGRLPIHSASQNRASSLRPRSWNPSAAILDPCNAIEDASSGHRRRVSSPPNPKRQPAPRKLKNSYSPNLPKPATSQEIVKDLFVTNGAILASRKKMPIKSRILDGRGITDTPYNGSWRKFRHIVSAFLGARAVDGYNDTFDSETTELLQELYRCGQAGAAPVNPRPHAGRFSFNVMLSIVYGDRTDSINHPLVAHALKLAREFTRTAHTDICKELRGPRFEPRRLHPAPPQRLPNRMTSRGENLHRDLIETYGGMALALEQHVKRGEIAPGALRRQSWRRGRRRNCITWTYRWLCSALMIGGLLDYVLACVEGETASVILWFSGLVLARPEIQAKAQAELDHVVGRDRLPALEDERDLPFVHALIKLLSTRFCAPGLNSLMSLNFFSGNRTSTQPVVARHFLTLAYKTSLYKLIFTMFARTAVTLATSTKSATIQQIKRVLWDAEARVYAARLGAAEKQYLEGRVREECEARGFNARGAVAAYIRGPAHSGGVRPEDPFHITYHVFGANGYCMEDWSTHHTHLTDTFRLYVANDEVDLRAKACLAAAQASAPNTKSDGGAW